MIGSYFTDKETNAKRETIKLITDRKLTLDSNSNGVPNLRYGLLELKRTTDMT
jgi:hypothetical protein